MGMLYFPCWNYGEYGIFDVCKFRVLLLILLLIETHYMWQILMKLGGFLVYFCFCFDKFREARMIVEGT